MIDANLKVEGDLRREVAANIKRKMEIGTYQGLRTAAVSRPRSAHPYECPHPEGTEEDGRRAQEKARK